MADDFKFYKKTLIISFIIFIVASVSIFYLGDFFIVKIDEKMGVTKDNMINVTTIAKNYDLKHDSPVLIVVYSTKIKTSSYIEIDEIRSQSSSGTNFTKRISLEQNYSGKLINLTIVAIDNSGKTHTLTQEVVLPKRIESQIRITG